MKASEFEWISLVEAELLVAGLPDDESLDAAIHLASHQEFFPENNQQRVISAKSSVLKYLAVLWNARYEVL